jgi:nucleoside recognition membrane protein YjiH
LAWAIASFVGGAIGGIASALLGNAGFGNWAIYGACLGLAQQIALKKYLPVTGWWAVASTFGWTLYPVNPVLAPFLVGLGVGLLQALTLKNVSGKGWWIGGNLIAWPLVTVIGLAIVGPIFNAFGPILGWVVAWGLAGMIGAVLLIYPLSQLTVKPEN